MVKPCAAWVQLAKRLWRAAAGSYCNSTGRSAAGAGAGADHYHRGVSLCGRGRRGGGCGTRKRTKQRFDERDNTYAALDRRPAIMSSTRTHAGETSLWRAHVRQRSVVSSQLGGSTARTCSSRWYATLPRKPSSGTTEAGAGAGAGAGASEDEPLHADPVVAALLSVVPSLTTTKQPLVLCGPSGVGKSYVLNSLCAMLPDQVSISVSHTSREPRGKEMNGIEYHFVSKENFKSMADQGKMIEYDEIHGNLYGTSVAAVEAVHALGKVCIMDLTVEGAVQFVDACSAWQYGLGLYEPPAPFCVHLKPPSLDELARRLQHRGTESAAELEKRLANAQTELDDAAAAEIWDLELVKGLSTPEFYTFLAESS